MPTTTSVVPRWERLFTPADGPRAGTARGVGVDRRARVIRGYTVAQEGAFKTAGRGAFDQYSLMQVVRLMNAAPGGVRVRFGHPPLLTDGIGSFLGRAKNARLDGDRVRADLHLARAASKSPRGDLADYVLALAEEDPAAMSSSLVLESAKERPLDRNGRPLLGPDGQELPPLWRPTAIHFSDIVETGEAVHGGLLGVANDRPPDRASRRLARLRVRLHRLDLRRPLAFTC